MQQDIFQTIDNSRCGGCTKCPDLVASRTQIVYASKAKKRGLLVVGEAPGAKEDELGEGFVGMAGVTLDRLLSPHNISRRDYSRANICRCRPQENRIPTTLEIDSCLSFLVETIIELNPRVILTVGATPTKVFCGAGNLYDKILDRQDDCSASMCHATAHELIKPVLRLVDFIVPTPHTSPLAFNRNAPSGEKWAIIAQKQIATAVARLKQ